MRRNGEKNGICLNVLLILAIYGPAGVRDVVDRASTSYYTMIYVYRLRLQCSPYCAKCALTTCNI